MTTETALLVFMGVTGLFAVGAAALAWWANRKPHAKHDDVAHSH